MGQILFELILNGNLFVNEIKLTLFNVYGLITIVYLQLNNDL